MNKRLLILSSLWVLLLMGLYGGITVSWATFTEVAPCPEVKGVHVCYVILACYALMMLAQVIRSSTLQNIIFYSSWAVVFGVALFASILEAGNGHTCPKSSSGFALCYFSLLLSGLIGLLFWLSNKRN